MSRTRTDELLLGEWACLGVLAQSPAHGYDISVRLAPGGDIGRVWSMSRSLTYRAVDQLTQRELIRAVSVERGIAGGNRTILALTRRGRSRLRQWLREPVPHFRDVRDELMLKLVICELAAVDPRLLLEAQRATFAPMIDALAAAARARNGDVEAVALWRFESSRAVLRFLDRLIRTHATCPA